MGSVSAKPGLRTRLLAEDAAALRSTLAFMDQASYLWVRASGHVHGIQCTWVYRREIDVGGLRRMHDNLAHGLLGRRVERSALPFGRHHWVTCHELPGIDIDEPASGPAAVTDWFEERARIPVHPEFGPAWHLGVLPIADYGTAVSLVASHTVIDGVGLCGAISDAVKGIRHDFGFPAPRSRTRRRALVTDARRTVRGIPEVAHAVGGLASLAVRNPPTRGAKIAKTTAREPDRPVAVPTATVYIDLAEWDARAESLGGTSNALLAGFAAKLAEKYGRVRADDGLVTLAYPVNDRTEDDLRANALKGIDFTVDPKPVTSDLRAIRRDFKEAIAAGLGKFKEQERVFPLTPFVPAMVVKKLPLAAVNAADLPVGCSNFGEINSATAHADGTEADYVTIRMVEQNLTTRSPELASGELYMTAGRICGKVFISLRAYAPGSQNSRQALLAKVSDTLADFALTAVIE